MWAVNTGTLVMLGTILYTPFSGFLKLEALSVTQFFIVLGFAVASVLWYELVKLGHKVRAKKVKKLHRL
jgi:Ca2+-transporting ATPase